jgi:hypothetical protein
MFRPSAETESVQNCTLRSDGGSLGLGDALELALRLKMLGAKVLVFCGGWP